MRKSLESLGLAGLVCLVAAGVPQGVEAAAETAQAPAAAASPATVTSADLSEMMRRMQAMHARLAAAKTPAERQPLMSEHFKLIQEGLTMLQQLRSRSSKDATTEHMLQQRMDMMTMLMRMMVDRELTAAAGTDCVGSGTAAPRK